MQIHITRIMSLLRETQVLFFFLQVVCSKCSGQKYPLSFEDNKLCRVCRSCYQILIYNQKKQLCEATTKQELILRKKKLSSSSLGSRSRSREEVEFDEGQEHDLGDLEEEEVECNHAMIIRAEDAPTRPKGLLEVRISDFA